MAIAVEQILELGQERKFWPMVRMELPKHLIPLRQELARRHLLDFIRYTFPQYQVGWFNRDVCALMENFLRDIEQKKSPRLIIQSPPRHGKSLIASIQFPAWAIGKNPDMSFIISAYASDLAERNSRLCQNVIEQERYAQIFPQVKPSTQRADTWMVEGHGGVIRAAGIGGATSGYGADCLPAGTMISTQQGPVEISRLCAMKKPPKIISYNHQEEHLEAHSLEAFNIPYLSTRLVRLTTASGRTLNCTGNHRIHVPQRGYPRASDLRAEKQSRLGFDAVLCQHQSQICQEAISGIEDDKTREIKVYDLQIAGNHNFFADGILVHNCLILDDFCKDMQEAESAAIQKRNIDWFWSVAYTRLAKGGGIVIIGTRWSLGDLIGHVLEADKDKGEEWKIFSPWKIFSYSAIAEEDEIHRKAGEALHPERYSLETLLEIKNSIGKAWLPLYQQRPQMTEGRCYFLVEGHEPQDKSLQVYQAKSKPPAQRGILDEEGKFKQDDFGSIMVWEKPLEHFCYAAGLDTAEGEEAGQGGDLDSHVLRIIRRGPLPGAPLYQKPLLEVGDMDRPAFVLSYVSQIDPDELAFVVEDILRWFNLAYVLVENNSTGSVVLKILKKIYPWARILADTTRGESDLQPGRTTKLGLHMDIHKPALLNDLKAGLREEKFDNPDADAIFQYRHFISKGGKLGAAFGYHDDYVIADALAWRCHLKAPRKSGETQRKAVKRERLKPLFAKVGY